MKKVLISLLFIFISCFISACNNGEIAESNYKPFESNKIPQYEAEKSENQESLIYIEGTLCNSFELDMNSAFFLTDENELYILIIGNSLMSYTDELEKYCEKDIIAYGKYEGIRNVKDYGETPVINIDEIKIKDEKTVFTKSDFERYEIQENKGIQEIDKLTIRQIEEIVPISKMIEYYTFDKKTSETKGPTLSVDISANTPAEMITAAEGILNINNLHTYKNIIINCKDINDDLLGTINYTWNDEKQRYISSCMDLSEDKELEKEYKSNSFFYNIDIKTVTEGELNETIGSFYLNN